MSHDGQLVRWNAISWPQSQMKGFSNGIAFLDWTDRKCCGTSRSSNLPWCCHANSWVIVIPPLLQCLHGSVVGLECLVQKSPHVFLPMHCVASPSRHTLPMHRRWSGGTLRVFLGLVDRYSLTKDNTRPFSWLNFDARCSTNSSLCTLRYSAMLEWKYDW